LEGKLSLDSWSYVWRAGVLVAEVQALLLTRLRMSSPGAYGLADHTLTEFRSDIVHLQPGFEMFAATETNTTTWQVQLIGLSSEVSDVALDYNGRMHVTHVLADSTIKFQYEGGSPTAISDSSTLDEIRSAAFDAINADVGLNTQVRGQMSRMLASLIDVKLLGHTP
jgi:hypothetical protein